MQRFYITAIEPVLPGGIELNIDYFRNIGILKNNDLFILPNNNG